ncbi:phosphate ABC transporter permease subunit PstC [Gryllotalpicola protaetiae]|uniref:phosphate ABC transporter permease subunit PstC n=1 Tax=Gryllotalpicola protaetiae TaxID=2419771 RepID=UPI001FE27B27|nr:phosphate ABC transporter permease subunit PstC [Gryllotalpicola protaetiae]
MTESTAAAPSRRIVAKARPSDRIFKFLSTGSATLIIVILAGVALFLIIKSAPAITASWTTGDLAEGTTAHHSSFWSYTAPLIWGTLWVSLLGLLMGAPVAIGIALFISHYAPRSVAGVLAYLVDLLAAVPSIIFGLWGIFTIRKFLLPFQAWLNHHVGWFPLFGGDLSTTGSTAFAGGVVLAVMILPIITSITREIFLQTPRLHEEAALALGATKWETVRLAVFPYARSGMLSAILLGLGRALGETMAIALIMSPTIGFFLNWFTDNRNSQTIAANIALNFPESNQLQREALIGTGLALFVISLVVNFAARFIIGRTGKSGGGKKVKRLPPTNPSTMLALDDAESPLAALHPHASSAHPEGLKPSQPEGPRS